MIKFIPGSNRDRFWRVDFHRIFSGLLIVECRTSDHKEDRGRYSFYLGKFENLPVLPVKQVKIRGPISTAESSRRSLPVKDSFLRGVDALLDVLAFSGVTRSTAVSGVTTFRLSVMHQFWNIVSYKFRPQMCVSSFIRFMFEFGTCAAEVV